MFFKGIVLKNDKETKIDLNNMVSIISLEDIRNYALRQAMGMDLAMTPSEIDGYVLAESTKTIK